MNKLNFSNTGGFPFDTNILDFMQDSYNLLNAIGEIAGNLTILKGCTVTGTSVSDGVVFINGEVLAFKGGTGSKVIIKEDVTQLPFEDGSSKDVEKVRYATFGLASTSFLWSDFTRAQRAIVPRGLISMWSGANIPAGWALCNGENGTPDLQNRFIMGASDQSTIGTTGGLKEVTLTADQMPQHSHAATISEGGEHSHQFKNYYYVERNDYSDGRGGSAYKYEAIEKGVGSHSTDSDNNRVFYKNMDTSNEESHSHNITIGNKGGGEAYENRPPYFALAYIMFKG